MIYFWRFFQRRSTFTACAVYHFPVFPSCHPSIFVLFFSHFFPLDHQVAFLQTILNDVRGLFHVLLMVLQKVELGHDLFVPFCFLAELAIVYADVIDDLLKFKFKKYNADKIRTIWKENMPETLCKTYSKNEIFVFFITNYTTNRVPLLL